MEPKFKEGDTVKLNPNYIERVMTNDKVFVLYHGVGVPRNWIVSLCEGTPMRVLEVDKDHDNNIVLSLMTDPREVVWQQEWFELVSHDVISEMSDMDEEWFKIE
jgi:hypothetical protein